jgi:hypothetical protein
MKKMQAAKARRATIMGTAINAGEKLDFSEAEMAAPAGDEGDGVSTGDEVCTPPTMPVTWSVTGLCDLLPNLKTPLPDAVDEVP